MNCYILQEKIYIDGVEKFETGPLYVWIETFIIEILLDGVTRTTFHTVWKTES